jgi:hypothetical protein
MAEFNIKRFAAQVRKLDDQLGQFSDYEGDADGPTFYVFKMGKERWERRCEQAAELHEQAARLWRRALKTSQKGATNG